MRRFPYRLKKTKAFIYSSDTDRFRSFDVVFDKSTIGPQANLYVRGSKPLPSGLVPGMPIFLPDGFVMAILRHDYKSPGNSSAIGVHMLGMALPGALYRHPGSWKALSESEMGPPPMYGLPEPIVPGMYDPPESGS